MIIGGVLLLILATIFFFVARSNASKLAAMNAAETYDAATLGAVHGKIVAGLGATAFAQPCEVEGRVESDAPLDGPVSGQVLVAYTHTVSREYEERVTTTDSAGKRETKVERRSEQVQSSDRRAPFYIRDASGRVLVLPDGAEIELTETANTFEDSPQPWSGATRTLGRRQIERGLAVGTTVYVLGTAIDRGGQPAIARHPVNTKQRFMISLQGEQALANSAAAWSRNMYYAAGGAGAVGSLLTLWGLIGG